MIKKVCFLFILLLISNSSLSQLAPKVKLNSVNSLGANIAEEVMGLAYSRIGYQLSLRVLPRSRSLEWSNSGYSDGELFRTANMEYKYENLRVVPWPIINFQARAFTLKRKNIKVNNWAELKQFKVGIVRGQVFAEDNSRGMRKVVAGSLLQLFQMLELGRVDVVIGSRMSALNIVQEYNFEGVEMLDNAVIKLPVYHYLHKSNSHLVGPLADALEELHRQGIPKKIMQREVYRLRHTGKLWSVGLTSCC